MREFKLVVLGPGGVGKSALTVRYIQNIFVDKYDPTIEDSYRTQKIIDGEACNIEILDTAGTEQFTAMRDLYMRNGDGFVLVYAINSKASFMDVHDIREQILTIKNDPSIPVMLVGNKCDLERERVVAMHEGQSVARNMQCGFLECSAKNKVCVDEAFTELIKAIKYRYPERYSAHRHKDKFHCKSPCCACCSVQ